MQPYQGEQGRHSDIALLKLAEPIGPGEEQTLQFSYVLKIPKVFSRPGHDGSLYRMTQWYPKPAVYDTEGWHPMPYLSIGEFYAEYGDYDVTLKLPAGHAVAATGELMHSVEGNLGQSVRMEAEQVCDFAWFSSGDYVLESSSLELGDQSIEVHLLTNRTDDNTAIIKYMKRALLFYSEEIGDYPYPQYSLVYDEGQTRGGMEYPMISMVDHTTPGQNLDNLIAHEIGHNWFQSALGTNERLYPWMDEGLNSYYERAYNAQYYTKPNYNLLPGILHDNEHELSLMSSGVCHYHCCGRLGPIDQPSGEVDVITYGTNSYERMAFSMQYLEAYLGAGVMKEGMHRYYEDWKHKHPSPADLKQVFESVSDRDLSWFFEDIIQNNRRYDYHVKSVDADGDLLYVHLANKGELDIPIALDCYIGDQLAHSRWIPVDQQETAISIPAADYDRISINGEVPFTDDNRMDNHWRHAGVLPRLPKQKIGPLFNIADSRHRKISWLPALSFNVYDGLQLGVHLHSDFFPHRKLRWYAQPQYGISSKRLTGVFGVERDFGIANPKFNKITLGLMGRRFSYDESLNEVFTLAKLSPYVALHFNSGLLETQRLEYRLHRLRDNGGFLLDRVLLDGWVHQLNYVHEGKTRLGGQQLLAQIEYEDYVGIGVDPREQYVKLSLDYRRQMHYNAHSQFYFRVFGGYHLINSRRESSSFASAISRGSFALTQQGYTDHIFEGYYPGRMEQDGFLSRQFADEEGGFKLPLGSANRIIGNSNSFILTANLKADLPWGIIDIIKFRPWVDLGILQTKSVTADPLEMELFYAGGFSVELSEYLGIYLPIIYSDQFEVGLDSRSIWERISFKLDIHKLNFWRFSESPSFLF